eukprot:8168116-Alexandrium_andersonii.AAC.1
MEVPCVPGCPTASWHKWKGPIRWNRLSMLSYGSSGLVSRCSKHHLGTGASCQESAGGQWLDFLPQQEATGTP